MSERFDTWHDAFDVCRERGHPMVVLVGNEEAKIYPSGTCKTLRVPYEPDHDSSAEAAEHAVAQAESQMEDR